ncbi:MAG: hypothetical protein JXR96_11745 [Deltaproteobacteria bacterium]|nr:hypothetical protein [Deltaproteobacteria bacterium]
MRASLAAVAGLMLLGVLLPGCPLQPVDTRARWGLDADCETHGIVEWAVTFTKQSSFGESYPCTGPGDYVSDAFRIHEGHCSVSVEALDSAGRVLAVRTTDGEVVADRDVFYFDLGTFTAADFADP